MRCVWINVGRDQELLINRDLGSVMPEALKLQFKKLTALLINPDFGVEIVSVYLSEFVFFVPEDSSEIVFVAICDFYAGWQPSSDPRETCRCYPTRGNEVFVARHFKLSSEFFR